MGLVQACIVCAFCTGEYTALCIVATVIGLQCLSWPLLPMVCGLVLHLLPWQINRGGISPDHAACQGHLILHCYTAALHWISSGL